MAGEAVPAEPGARQRAFIRGSRLTMPENAAGIPRLRGGSRIAACQWVSQWSRVLQPGKCVFPGRRVRPGDRGVPQSETVPPARSVSPSKPAAVLSVAPGHLPEPPAPWWTHVLFWSGWLSFPEKAYGAFAGYLLAALVAAGAIFLRRARLYWVSAVIVIGATVLALDAGLAYAEIAWSRHAVVTGETIARKGIGKDYEPALTNLSRRRRVHDSL